MSYCPFFQTLHDETRPVGNLGRGTHYSILRAPVWHDELLNRLDRCAFLDLAVIWDEDHDDRVIDALMMLYVGGLLSPVRYIGERKGTLSVLLAPDAMRTWTPKALQQYRDDIENVCQCLEDPWTAKVDAIDGREHSIIHSSAENVSIYLRNIDVLWELGVKPKTRS
ncbi:hypothetical protein OOOCML_33290 (plasmid) [Cupriavidus necator H16]|uniref:Uncharacterized protein n=1 Tax=Cupriavidus necator (strain ATCC 17699 / DSM 428 / KCTC 22496 / NCIMB 10442 / H16 / Stanier 337) TaxID=381666 RepID=Q7WXE2_CUPNH|nr:hypothetical protein [Cupriavidus necator]AAP85944.1 hypothetical protein PHG192 [Cupriavidus necator H16]QCC05442.1 hypothetical protein E6A55_33175 [Cupriavidus necator H16]QQB81266.1 hypothetical protein I6H87_33155 [Cupriavidus necator]